MVGNSVIAPSLCVALVVASCYAFRAQDGEENLIGS